MWSRGGSYLATFTRLHPRQEWKSSFPCLSNKLKSIWRRSDAVCARPSVSGVTLSATGRREQTNMKAKTLNNVVWTDDEVSANKLSSTWERRICDVTVFRPEKLPWCEGTRTQQQVYWSRFLSRTRLCQLFELDVYRPDRTLRFWFSQRQAGEHLTALRRRWRPKQSYKKSHRVTQPQGINKQ